MPSAERWFTLGGSVEVLLTSIVSDPDPWLCTKVVVIEVEGGGTVVELGARLE